MLDFMISFLKNQDQRNDHDLVAAAAEVVVVAVVLIKVAAAVTVVAIPAPYNPCNK